MNNIYPSSINTEKHDKYFDFCNKNLPMQAKNVPQQKLMTINNNNNNINKNYPLIKPISNDGLKINNNIKNQNYFISGSQSSKNGPVKIQNDYGMNQNNTINTTTIKKPNNITKPSNQNTIVPARSNSKQNNDKNERPSTAPSKNDIKDKNTGSLSNNHISNNNSIPLKRLPSPAIKSNNQISNNKLGGSMKYRSQSPMTLGNQHNNNNNNKNYNMYSFKGNSQKK